MSNPPHPPPQITNQRKGHFYRNHLHFHPSQGKGVSIPFLCGRVSHCPYNQHITALGKAKLGYFQFSGPSHSKLDSETSPSPSHSTSPDHPAHYPPATVPQHRHVRPSLLSIHPGRALHPARRRRRRSGDRLHPPAPHGSPPKASGYAHHVL